MDSHHQPNLVFSSSLSNLFQCLLYSRLYYVLGTLLFLGKEGRARILQGTLYNVLMNIFEVQLFKVTWVHEVDEGQRPDL